MTNYNFLWYNEVKTFFSIKILFNCTQYYKKFSVKFTLDKSL
nr:MAG TPA: hypothetical protein [Herelleviridae sp.]